MRAVPSPQTSLAARAAARAAPETPLCESLQRCVKGKHVLHSESQGSLSLLISVMKCFPPPARRIQAPALPQTNLLRGSAHVQQHGGGGPRLHSEKGCFSFYEHHFECSLFGLLITAMLEEHVVHVCSIYPLIRLQGSALKHALRPPPTPQHSLHLHSTPLCQSIR